MGQKQKFVKITAETMFKDSKKKTTVNEILQVID